jgi:hypothetical protein|nr:MAG TPA: hypothetical protein [Caudoviricetes sp.]
MNIDTTAIEGFETMTPEQKVEALLRVEVPEKIDLSGYVSKDIADKYASEAADFRKKLASKMTDEEAAKAQADAERKELEEKYNALVRKSTIADHTARYLATPGYDEKLARETAEALFDGNMDKVFENQKIAADAYEKKLKADLLRNTPRPNGAIGNENDPPENIKIAKQIGAARAASRENSNAILKKYVKGDK